MPLAAFVLLVLFSSAFATNTTDTDHTTGPVSCSLSTKQVSDGNLTHVESFMICVQNNVIQDDIMTQKLWEREQYAIAQIWATWLFIGCSVVSFFAILCCLCNHFCLSDGSSRRVKNKR